MFDEYDLSVTKQILSRELRALGYRKLSARPRHHEHDEAAVVAFKKAFAETWGIFASGQNDTRQQRSRRRPSPYWPQRR